MTKLNKIEVPELYSIENDNDPIVKIHFKNPNGRGDWFVTEGQMECDGNWLFFGFVRSPLQPEFDEFGYFTLSELKDAGIVKDCEWDSKPLSKAKDEAIAIEALQAIIKNNFGVNNFFIHLLCIGAKDIVQIGGTNNPETHVHGTYEDKILWIEKIGLIRLFDLTEQLMQ